MRRPLAPEDARLWSLVAATVRPSGEHRLKTEDAAVTTVHAPDPPSNPKARRRLQTEAPATPLIAAPSRSAPAPKRSSVPDKIEPRRRRRISQAREPIGARLDLHGMDQSRAQLAVFAFVRRAYEDGMRAILIITGKGTLGDGILRRRTPEWLSDPSIRPLIAGFSIADRHHGGDGAVYVALKRNGR